MTIKKDLKMKISNKKVALNLATTAVGLVYGNTVFAAENNTWTGFNVYGGINYSTVKADEKFNAADSEGTNTWFTSAQSSDSKVSGILGLGYDHQVSDKFVIGVFGDYNFADAKTSTKQISETTNNTYAMSYSTKVKDAFSLGLKLGYAAGANDLFYVTAGATRAKVEVKASIADSNGNGVSASNSNSKTGQFVGLGLEHKVNDNVSLVADYRFTDFGKVKVNANNGNWLASNHADAKTHNLSLNLKYKF